VTLELLRTRIKSEWTDYNGHLNVAYYHMVFDQATDEFFDQLGVGEVSARKGVGAMFALEDHITYQQELKASDRVRVTLQLLDFDAKRVHFFLRMFHEEQGYLAATCEHLSTYVDFQDRRSAPMPAAAQTKLTELYDAHRSFPKPKEASQVIGIRRG
jgi:acyl-CoA thioester hydrolase